MNETAVPFATAKLHPGLAGLLPPDEKARWRNCIFENLP